MNSYKSNKNVTVNKGSNYGESTYKGSEGKDIQYDISTFNEVQKK